MVFTRLVPTYRVSTLLFSPLYLRKEEGRWGYYWPLQHYLPFVLKSLSISLSSWYDDLYFRLSNDLAFAKLTSQANPYLKQLNDCVEHSPPEPQIPEHPLEYQKNLINTFEKMTAKRRSTQITGFIPSSSTSSQSIHPSFHPLTVYDQTRSQYNAIHSFCSLQLINPFLCSRICPTPARRNVRGAEYARISTQRRSWFLAESAGLSVIMPLPSSPSFSSISP